ncbi:MAG: hypothetical protein RJB39_583 [Candidatus Parcubacteria bacterium]|jgi:prepilin-type N-terminal cleavage/methylation domain-containing protein
MNQNRGFTLIELMVVIALVGMLALIVLAALSSAKGRGDDAGIQSTMKNLQTQSGLYYSQNGNVGVTSGDCVTAGSMFADATTYGLSKLLTGLRAKTTVACFSTAAPSNIWIISAQLKSDPTKYWCIDHGGISRQRTQPATSTLTMCDAY